MANDNKSSLLKKFLDKQADNKKRGEKSAAEWRAIVRSGKRGGLENGWTGSPPAQSAEKKAAARGVSAAAISEAKRLGKDLGHLKAGAYEKELKLEAKKLAAAHDREVKTLDTTLKSREKSTTGRENLGKKGVSVPRDMRSVSPLGPGMTSEEVIRKAEERIASRTLGWHNEATLREYSKLDEQDRKLIRAQKGRDAITRGNASTAKVAGHAAEMGLTPSVADAQAKVDAALQEARLKRGDRRSQSQLDASLVRFQTAKQELQKAQAAEAAAKEASRPPGAPKKSMAENVDRINQNMREDYYDSEDSEKRRLNSSNLPPDRLKKEIEYSKKHGYDDVTVKIPSHSEFSMSMEEAIALDARNDGVSEAEFQRRVKKHNATRPSESEVKAARAKERAEQDKMMGIKPKPAVDPVKAAAARQKEISKEANALRKSGGDPEKIKELEKEWRKVAAEKKKLKSGSSLGSGAGRFGGGVEGQKRVPKGNPHGGRWTK